MKLFSRFCELASSLAIICYAISMPASAQQIRTDNSLSTTVNTLDNLNFTIEAGDRIGNNLFHSFDKFSVSTAGSAVFANPADITNIISRVTGGNLID